MKTASMFSEIGPIAPLIAGNSVPCLLPCWWERCSFVTPEERASAVITLESVATDPAERLAELGNFIRDRRRGAQMTLRRMSELAGVSNPYLSQIERGLRKPSAEILQQIARALSVSAETLYVRAGILEHDSAEGLEHHIEADAHLTDAQKVALTQIYRSFRTERSPKATKSPSESAKPESAQPQPNKSEQLDA